MKALKSIGLTIAFVCFMTGVFLKLMHWPFAGGLMAIGVVISMIIPVRGFFDPASDSTDKVLYAVQTIGIITVLVMLAIGFNHPMITNIWKFLLIGVVFVEVYRGQRNGLTKNFWKRVITLASLVAAIGFLFKVLHWPYASPLIIGGLSLATVSYLIDFFTMRFDEEEDGEKEE